MIKRLSFFLVPFQSSSRPLYPQSAASQGTWPDSLLFRGFTSNSHWSLFRNFGAHQPPYHTIYLIIKLSRLNLMFIKLKDYLISIGPFINTLQLLHEFQTSLLLTKYYKTNVLLNTMNFGVCFYPQPSRDFSPLITQLRF